MVKAGNFTLTPCGVCSETSETNEGMVGCDACDLWFHFRCVEVTEESLADLEKWFCPSELCQKVGEEILKKPDERKKGGKSKGSKALAPEESDKSSVKSDRQSGSALEKRLKALEKEQRAKEREMEIDQILREKQIEMARILKEKQRKIDNDLREKEMQLEKEMLEQTLRDEQAHAERMQQMRESYQKAIKSVKSMVVKSDVPDTKISKADVEEISLNAGEGCSSQLRKQPKKNLDTPLRNPNISLKTDLEKRRKSTDAKHQQLEESDTSSDDEYGSVDETSDEESEDDSCSSKTSLEDQQEEESECEWRDARPGADRLCRKKKKPVQHGLGRQKAGPTKAQLAARNGLSKKLPTFTGKPEEWPLFIGSFEASNTACGFNDVENLVRLQESLQGNALESVRGLLLLPKSVPKVISKLRQLYGRPEQLLYCHLEKVKRLDPPKADKLETFIPFGNVVEQMCDHLEAAGMKEHLINPILIQDLVDKLPAGDKREWVRYRNKKRSVTLRTFAKFLSKIVSEACAASVSLENKPEPKTKHIQAGKGRTMERGALYTHSASESPTAGEEPRLKPCRACKRTDHRLRYCQDFKAMTLVDRMKIVEKGKLCQICLNDHGNAPCKFKGRCNVGECQARHHFLLHPLENLVAINTHIRTSGSIMFRMVPVTLHYGEKHVTTLAFLDEGSSITLIERSLADGLNAAGVKWPLTIKWTADITREEPNSRMMNLWISAFGKEEKFPLQAAQTVEKLLLPKQTLDVTTLTNKYSHLRNLPIHSYSEQRPGLLIGLNNLHTIAPMEVKVRKIGEPIGVRSKLGWSIYGPTSGETVCEEVVNHHHGISNVDLYNLMKEHYSLEESAVKVVQETKDEKRAREILERTTVRVGDRFETGLLWRTDDCTFPDSLPMARRRLKQLEQRLQKFPELHERIREQIEDYQRKGYAHVATPNELAKMDPEKRWYLPLNYVQNPKKPSKIRLIWDAAASVDGVSLNSQLLKGPDMLTPLTAVLSLFRERRVAVGGDIREMYHQLRIREADKQAQLFLFRKNLRDVEPSVYIMDVATFGSTSSPCSAQYVKNLNASEHLETYPEAAAAIIDKHYVDDYYDSVDTVEEAIRRAKEIRFIHSKAGFEIRNWVSNSPEVLQSLGERNPAQAVHFSVNKETETERVLGIIWSPNQDTFSFAIDHRPELKPLIDGRQRPTKRLVLSCVMGFFDPLGLLSPFTIHGKTLIQDLWRSGCDWDDEIDDEALQKWKRWTGLLTQVAAIRIPRCYFGDSDSSEIDSLQLHIFMDASEHAYGCVAYFRAVVNGQVKTALVTSRSKVAPLKRQSIPRLELMAAVLGSRLLLTVQSHHSLQINKYFLWTDSQTALSWIRSDQLKYKQFVAFRIGEIREHTNISDWRWIPTKSNIADVLTKWGQGPPLESNSEWFNGPQFLLYPENQWPTGPFPAADTSEEMRARILHHEAITCEPIINVQSTNRFVRLLRTAASILRFIANCRRKIAGHPIVVSKATTGQERLLKAEPQSIKQPLQQDELRAAETVLWRQAQRDGFNEEVGILERNLNPNHSPERIKKSSSVYKMIPLMDTDGVMRVKGRLQQAGFATFDMKHPIILPKGHAITNMLILNYHEKFAHANKETVCNELRQRFHIPKLRQAIRQAVKDCMWCRVNRCIPQTPMMAPLPVQRVTPQLRPFSSVGVDYLGPVEVLVGRRWEKRWIALFTCLAVRAIHLEVVHGLTTQACLMAIRRFICRRGVPDELFSDNGTNFKGACSELAKIKQINQECAEGVTSSTLKWSFIPPGTPHMGGIWERMVRSVKEALKVLNDGRKLTDEILLTSLSEAEDAINTRPLVYLPQEADSSAAITPNHFLRGVVKDADFNVDGSVDFAKALRDTYKRSQYLADQMWQRWCKEYLPTINMRSKWVEDRRQVRIGDLVFIVNDGQRKNWTRGVIVEVFEGNDGRIRQVSVRTTKGVSRRAVSNLAVIEISGKSGSPGEEPELRAGVYKNPQGSQTSLVGDSLACNANR